jgi:4-hydroxyphenylacetate 3-monooxygenase
MIRSGEEYLQGLRDGRQVYFGSERVDDVTTHLAFRNTARSFARLYDRKREAAALDKVTFEDGGQRFSNWFLIPRTREDLEKRASGHQQIAEWTHGLLGRSMDHVPSFISGMVMNRELFTANRPEFADHIVNYHDYLKRRDLFCTYLVLTPQGSRNPELYKAAGRKNPAMQIVSEDSEGVVVSGVKTLGTSTIFSDEAFIGSMIPLGPDQLDEAITFAIPVNTPGIQMWVRDSYEAKAANSIDNYFSSQFDESDAVMVLDNVKIPWERIFVFRDVALMRNIYFQTPGHIMGNHQSNWRFVEKMKLLIGIAHKAAEMNGVIGIPAIQQTLGKLAAAEASLLGLLSGQIASCETMDGGMVHVNRRYLYATLQWCAHTYYELAERVREMLGAGPFQLPANASILEAGPLKETYLDNWYSPGSDAEERYKFVKMAWDLLGSDYAGRMTQYEKFYGGPPHIMDMYSFWNCPWDQRRGTVDAILQNMGGPASTEDQR